MVIGAIDTVPSAVSVVVVLLSVVEAPFEQIRAGGDPTRKALAQVIPSTHPASNIAVTRKLSVVGCAVLHHRSSRGKSRC